MAHGGFTWGHEKLGLALAWDDDHGVELGALAAGTVDETEPGPPLHCQPLVEALIAGGGRRRATGRLTETAVGSHLRYRSHSTSEDADSVALEITQHDEETGLTAITRIVSPRSTAGLRIEVTAVNDGESPVILEAVAVAVLAGAPTPTAVDDLDLLLGRSEWLAENRWERRPLRDSFVDLQLAEQPGDPKGSVSVVSTGTWSTGRVLPVGVLVDGRTGRSLAWQVETNGAWRWEVAERRAGAVVALSGPTDTEHQWTLVLEPGARFTSVPVTVAVGPEGGDVEGAIAELTRYRRASRARHPDNDARPVVFNDYMNTLEGDPSTAKLLPLIDAAAEVGAETFVIDAGWYDDGGEWWTSVGEWLPSTKRFPGGLGEVIDRIRDAGMIPGLWLEPEVVGVRSPIAKRLPMEAFLQRRGVRVRETARYALDLRHPAARAHLDGVVDRLVSDFGIGHLKLDYNIDAGVGTDLDADSAGAGLLAANRAHLAWLDGIRNRHPTLVLENCASGAMRSDFALLRRMQLQSTSDQQSPTLYPPIAAAAPLQMLPEQAASWAYPQPEMSAEQAAFTLVTAMLGRFYLSGHLDRMTGEQRALVAEAVTAHRTLRAAIGRATPFWPLGLPAWSDPWAALGLLDGDEALVSLWRRDGGAASTDLALPGFRGRQIDVEVVFPASLPQWTSRWDADRGVLTIEAAAAVPAARTLRLTAR
ncbi:MAG TPA: glycoside hydrolase family 36 protein [Naasia sp.]